MAEGTNKNKKMYSITFTGKELLGNTTFDTTDEKHAKENGLFDERKAYKPLTIITGENELMPLVEKELQTMSEGEERIVKLLAKDAFGERRNELLRVVPLQNFIEQKINPFPGLILRIGNSLGKVQSVGSGRVRIDFNHPLAGRDIEYTVRLEKEYKDKKEISEQLYSKYYSRIPGTNKEYVSDTLHITLEGNAYKNLTKVNEAIKGIADELGVKLEFKEGKTIEGVKTENKEIQHSSEEHAHAHTHHNSLQHEEHVHGPECNHEHSHEEHAHAFTPKEETRTHLQEEIIDEAVTEEEKPKEKQVGINRTADTLAKQKPKTSFDTFKDSASTIQRPKKK